MSNLETKKPWLSKTNWVALLVAVASFVPSVSTWVASNPDTFMQLLGGVFFLLRAVTKGKISIE